MNRLIYYIVTLILTIGYSADSLAFQSEKIVSSIEEFNTAVDNAEPGSVIVMKDGKWKDVALKFTGEGTSKSPITLKAQTKGGVTIEGESYLELGGNFLIVEDLFFTNGYTPTNTVIQFKSDKRIANNSTVKNCVIENFTQPDRDTDDHWVEFWGRNNALDHCYIAGKSNTGPTVRVYLKGNEHINNRHQIVNNYFGPRPRKGGPHGETLQIGDSYTSMTPSYTNISHNLFDRCNGEVEIISSKSNFNTFSNNVFFESEGSLVLRHGNYATIDANLFIGNDNSSNIGGIRVINTGHWITNNYFYKLTGEEFRAPLAVMNGIPKSPLNRYNQVTDVVVAYNTWIDCGTPWNFGVGSNVDQSEVLPASEIRSARAERMLVANNVIYSDRESAITRRYDSIDGVTFKNNTIGGAVVNDINDTGVLSNAITIEKKGDMLFIPKEKLDEVHMGFDFETIETDLFGASRENQPRAGAVVVAPEKGRKLVDFSKYGPNWFEPKEENKNIPAITVSTAKALIEAIEKGESGVEILLEKGDYVFTKPLDITKKITLKAKSVKQKIKMSFNTEDAAFKMHPNGRLALEKLV